MRRPSRTVAIGAAAAAVLVVGSGVLLQRAESARQDEAVERVAQAFAAGAARGNVGEVPGTDAAAHDAIVDGLGTEPTVQVRGVQRDGGSATAELEWRWPLGPQGWSYLTRLPLRGEDEDWQVQPAPTTVHPELVAGQVLVAERTAPQRGQVLDRAGVPLVTATPVVEVGVQPSRSTDPARLSRTLGDLLDVDAAALEGRIVAAAPDAFVPVVVLRRSDYEPLRDQLQPLPGTVFREASLPLAPTRAFARALLGTAGPVTAELVEASGGRLAIGDVAGLSGLQRSYDERLGGAPGVTVSRVAGEQRTKLFTSAPVDGQPVQVSLDRRVQTAADAALATAAGGNGTAALVAVDVATGDLLAVAGTPVTGADRALTGQYPPGSTFKAVSTLALLGDGLNPGQSVDCPPTATVDGRSFRNFEGGALGAVPFFTAFAQSCNTAFVGLSDRLGGPTLPDTASSVGLGVPWSVGVDVFAGQVPAPASAVERAAAAIGQGRTLVSPAAMAHVAAAVARGSAAPSRLVLDPAPATPAAPPVPADPARLATVRDLMRQVVLSGTASALADVPGAPVHAKTGTAEYGTDSPPRTHAWTIGFQGGTAFAVLVEDGSSGGAAAVPVAEAFLRAIA